jgi:excinuclease ABC subunit A
MSTFQYAQTATTLSGGEARIKLSHELSKRDTGQTLYIRMNQPQACISRCRQLLAYCIVAQHGNTWVMNTTSTIKTADWIIDLGPKAVTRVAK